MQIVNDNAKTEIVDIVVDRLVFDGYEIIRPLGRGGMGMVYLARQTDHLDREVAIKTILIDYQTPYFKRHFLQEGQRQAELHHPHILPIFAAGEIDECLYIVMHYARDGSLRDQIGSGNLSAEQSASILIDLLKALHHAHNDLDKPLVHLDIKPENILFDGKNALLSDFGIARKIEQEAGAATMIAGDPRYWAPEQQSNAATTGSDIFALGTMFFEMLSGERPPQPLRVMTNRRNSDALQRLLPKPARKFGSLIVQCLHEDPARRPTAEELLSNLRGLLRKKPGLSFARTFLVASLLASALFLTLPMAQKIALDWWRTLNPLPSYEVTFALTPLSSRLQIDGTEHPLWRAMLVQGEHEVTISANGYIGEFKKLQVSSGVSTVTLDLQIRPPVSDAEYLAFSAAFGVDPKTLRQNWRDPTLSNLAALEDMVKRSDSDFDNEISILHALSKAGDAVSSTTLFYAAFEKLPVPLTAASYQPALEQASTEGYALASLLYALYIMQRLLDTGETFDSNPQAFIKVETLLQKRCSKACQKQPC